MVCPKCQSTNIEITADRLGSYSTEDTRHLHCRTCGKMVYGSDKIEAIYKEQEAAWQASRSDEAPRKGQPPVWQGPATIQMMSANRASIRDIGTHIRKLLGKAEALFQDYQAKSTPWRRDEEVERHRNLLGLDVSRLTHLHADVLEIHKKTLQDNNPYESQRTYKDAKRLREEAEEAFKAASRGHVKGVQLLATLPQLVRVVPATSSERSEDSAGNCAWKDCEESPKANSKYCSVGCKNKNARWLHKQRKQPTTPKALEPQVVDLEPQAVNQEPQEDWDYLCQTSDQDLWGKNLGHLRKYARHTLNIVGASKIRGGKAALMVHILEARKIQQRA